MNDYQVYLTAPQVRARYSIHSSTLWRWLGREALGFPRPIKISERRFWKLADLESWEASRVEMQEGAQHAMAS